MFEVSDPKTQSFQRSPIKEHAAYTNNENKKNKIDVDIDMNMDLNIWLDERIYPKFFIQKLLEALGNHLRYSLWRQKPQILGIWTLQKRLHRPHSQHFDLGTHPGPSKEEP